MEPAALASASILCMVFFQRLHWCSQQDAMQDLLQKHSCELSPMIREKAKSREKVLEWIVQCTKEQN